MPAPIIGNNSPHPPQHIISQYAKQILTRCHLCISLTPTTIAPDLPPANSLSMHSRMQLLILTQTHQQYVAMHKKSFFFRGSGYDAHCQANSIVLRPSGGHVRFECPGLRLRGCLNTNMVYLTFNFIYDKTQKIIFKGIPKFGQSFFWREKK